MSELPRGDLQASRSTEFNNMDKPANGVNEFSFDPHKGKPCANLKEIVTENII